ncbi:MAG: acyl-CoA dehydrogenase family protein [Candidatus Tectomicrobia bacterium]|uniref:Acyl-CoA dehydrogenase family protein n=1 Tax=Tectimicrobiota bacterium TaxID=2528274 RepID=A0A933GL22_UNCTE|nr:acyl-CoA dehydrogenase family protein [Candidatus Tectomicrobia bacterium]
MNFDLTEEQRMMKENAKRFLEYEIAPLVANQEQRGAFDRETAGKIFKKLLGLGYLEGTFPEQWGGNGLDYLSLGIISEELWRIWPSLGLSIQANNAPAISALLSGQRELMEQLIPPTASGDMITCSAITEPNVGSNPREIQTVAVPDGDFFVINGTKSWISNGGIGDVVLLICKIKGEPDLHRILVERKESPFISKELHKLGLKAASTAELFFEDCRVPKKNRIGLPGDGLKETLKVFELARCLIAVGGVGIAQASLEAAIKYAMERRQWGKPLAGHQTIQHMIAEMDALTEASRFLAYRAFAMLDKGVRAARETSLAKYYCCESAVRVASLGLQIHGAYGLSDEFPLERYFRDARTLTIPDGTSEINRMIVAREILKVSAFA